MKPPHPLFTSSLIGLLAATLTACRPAESGTNTQSASAPAPAASYEPGRGLILPPATFNSMGLRIAPASLRSFTPSHQALAQKLDPQEQTDQPLHLRALVPENQAPPAGTTVSLKPPAATNHLTGHVAQVDRHLAPINGHVELLITVPAGHKGRLPDHGINISYPVSAPRRSVSVPASALIRAALGNFVYVQSDGRLARHRVALGQVTAHHAEILRGLKPGDQVVDEGADKLWILELALVGGMSNLPEPRQDS